MSRAEYIQKHFLQVSLTKDAMDVYVPRSAILYAVKECMSTFYGDLLDIGCGKMPYKEMILSANKKVTSYTGLDLVDSSIHNTSIADIHWDGNIIPLADKCMDSAMATEVLEHSFYPEKTLLEINRVLKSGGFFFFTVPFLWPLHETPHDAYRYTPFSLQKHLEASGFEQINLSSLGGWDASLAQLLGLWAGETKMAGLKKKLITKLILKLIPYLLRKDVKDNSFGQHCMITGLYGTAVKK